MGDGDRLRAGPDRLRDAGIDNLRVLAMWPPPDRSGGRYAG
ncbi:hypothetical protein [Luteimonas viscosa]|nr:hypothetical protein [Luteimonas viscosa]